jgi:uncharacterized protein YybS (DUF2232 family)
MLGKGSARMLGWSLLTVVMLLSVLLTPFNIITINLLMVPVMFQYVKLETKKFLLYYGLSLAVVYLVTSLFTIGWVGIVLVAISLFLLPPVIQMGNLYKRRAAARTVLTVGIVTLLTEMLLSILVAYLFGFNMIAKMKQFMLESLETVPEQLKTILLPIDPDTLVQLMSQLLPLYMIGISFFLILVTHWVARRLLNRSGELIPAFKPVRDWMLPRSFVWYYVVALFMELFVKDTSSVIFTVLLNLLPLLTVVFAIQGIAFLFHVAHIRSWNRALPIAGIVVLLVVPTAYFMFSLLGVFDVAFPIRERITRK